ncbi:rRNA N6-adenosine-methyltransferase ZCCHC4 isoform X1 [Bombyx mori]|uniref:rRNA N6-adenosine-methyltransferase ZCCHC4 isoform X1 n=1 Tax=Bombyx mori TaxID=7091 RepID=UPI002ED67550
MAKKRKIMSKLGDTPKSAPVEVVIEDVTNHPLCMHGPTLLFSSEKGRYFACSSCRNKKDCTVHISEEDWLKENVKKRNEKYYSLIPTINKNQAWNNFAEVRSRPVSDRAYCNTCQELYIVSKTKKHGKDHRVITPLMDEQLKQPSSWLPLLENDAVEAQYLFTKKSAGTVLGILKNNSIRNILCIGTPTVHEAAQAHPDFNSILLDYDKRYHVFHPPDKYIWYNMFNNYMFNANDDEKLLKKFFKKSRDGGICVVVDPPFGGRVEPLAKTLRELTDMYNKICEKDDTLLPVLWAFPYFSEPYITNMLPEIIMHDYQVEYENHKKFQTKTKTGRKYGSPVRFYTNLPLITIDLSNDKNYKFCDKCKYWVSVTNNHCNKCKECTSKNGMTYRHCNICKRCVKPTFFHCQQCERCCQEKEHVCGVEVTSQVNINLCISFLYIMNVFTYTKYIYGLQKTLCCGC